MKHFTSRFICKYLSYFFMGILPNLDAEDTTWKPETILEVNRIVNVDVSPDGQEVIYEVRTPKIDERNSRNIGQIWKGKAKDPNSHFQFTGGKYSSFEPSWSPDGNWIAFLSNRNGPANLFIISPTGGEATQVSYFEYGVSTFCWAPDSQNIAILAYQDIEPTEEENANLSHEVEVYPNKTGSSQLYYINPSLDKPKQITTPEYNVIPDINWSSDCKKIAFSYSLKPNPDSVLKGSQIAIVDLESESIEKVPQISPRQTTPKFSPDGKWLAFLKSDKDATYSFVLHCTLYSIEKKEFQQLPITPEEAPFIFGPSILGWSRDSSSLLFFEPSRTKFAIWRISINEEKIERIDDGKWTINNPVLSRNNKWIGMTLQSSSIAPEAYLTSTEEYSPVKVSNINNHLTQWAMPKTEVINWQSEDGLTIEGLLTFPKGYVPGQKYPFLLVVHGGPMGAYFETYLGGSSLYPLTAFADAGFVILRANPRGSCGYGRAFRHANTCDWGGNDYLDLMSGVDSLIDQGIVDENRMGVMGWSYGGYMTAWIISQTERFSAASMGAGLSNLTSFAGTTDIRFLISDYLETEFWENAELYHERSPIYYSNQISTPLLIQHGEQDKRVPLSQSIEFYSALRKLNKPVTFAIYPRSSHGISEPTLHLDALQRNFDWFINKVKDKNLKN